MAKDPAFLFYTSDFLVGVSDLTMEERGQYITLMCLQHTKGHLSAKNIKIAVGDVSPDVLAKFLVDSDGLYYNERLEQEINKRQQYCEKQANNVKKRWEKQKPKNDTTVHTVVLPTNVPSENVIVNIDIIINSIFNYWNYKKIIVHRELNKETKKAITKALTVYSEEQIKEYIDRYAKVVNDASYFLCYKWTLYEFLTRKEGISSFTDEGSKWCSYQAHLEKPNPKLNNQPSESTFNTDEFFTAALERSNKKMRERLSKK